MKAAFSFVPTPSLLDTRTGSLMLREAGVEEATESTDFAENPRGEGLTGELADPALSLSDAASMLTPDSL